MLCTSMFDLCFQVRELLEKKERLIQRKIDAEVEKAKEYSKAKNKRGALAFDWLPSPACQWMLPLLCIFFVLLF